MVSPLQICTMQMNFLSLYITSNMSNLITVNPFGTLLHLHSLCGWPLLLPMSCAFSHIVSLASSWLLHHFLHFRTGLPPTYFGYALTQSLAVQYLFLLPSATLLWHMSVRKCWLWSENSFQFIPVCLTLTTASVTTEVSRALLKTLIGSWTDVSSSSGCGSYSW